MDQLTGMNCLLVKSSKCSLDAALPASRLRYFLSCCSVALMQVEVLGFTFYVDIANYCGVQLE